VSWKPDSGVPQLSISYNGSPYASFDLLSLRTACVAATALPQVAVPVKCKMRFVGLKQEGGEKEVVYKYNPSFEYASVHFRNELLDVVSVRLELEHVAGIVPEPLGFVVASVSFDDVEVRRYLAH
jgi:hypothetical protein